MNQRDEHGRRIWYRVLLDGPTPTWTRRIEIASCCAPTRYGFVLQEEGRTLESPTLGSDWFPSDGDRPQGWYDCLSEAVEAAAKQIKSYRAAMEKRITEADTLLDQLRLLKEDPHAP